MSGAFFIRPFLAVKEPFSVIPRFRVVGVIKQHFTGKILAKSAVLKTFFFAARFYLALFSPVAVRHFKTAGAAVLFFQAAPAAVKAAF